MLKLGQYHRVLDIPVNRLVKSTEHLFRMPEDKPVSATATDPSLLLHDDVYQLLSQLGSLAGLLFEQRSSADKQNIHVDYDKVSMKPFWPCLNIILEGQGIMRWFEPIAKPQLSRASGNYYMAWTDPNNYGNVVDEWSAGKVALVRTDIPHNAFNYDDSKRFTVSVRWLKRYTWEETLEWFDSVFLPHINHHQLHL